MFHNLRTQSHHLEGGLMLAILAGALGAWWAARPHPTTQQQTIYVPSQHRFTPTGQWLRTGEQLEIRAYGNTNHQDNDPTFNRDPNGASLYPASKERYRYYDNLYATALPLGALFAQIGAHGTPTLVGHHATLQATNDGELLLGYNDSTFADFNNTGGFTVTINHQ